MSDHQLARMLVDSISSLTETTRELIHAQVVPFTRQGVSDYLREYETRQGWSSPAMREANSVDASQSSKFKKNSSRVRCTKENCQGPHPEEDCWARPENAKKKEDFLARRSGDRKGGQSTPQASTVRGRKKISPPSASVAAVTEDFSAFSLHASYEDVNTPLAAGATVPTTSNGRLWALHNTGATHHLFNNICLFDKSKLKPINDSNKRLKLAGGGVSLAVHSEGSVRLKAGDGTVFELKDCLYVPDLSKNLIAGGRLRLKGVREFYNPDDNVSFSLVINGLALFNGYIGQNGLMNVAIEPVSGVNSLQDDKTTTDDNSVLQHRRLGHIGNKYLRQMCKHQAVDGMVGGNYDVVDCKTCSLSKNVQLPFNHSRPRAVRFLENIHVDLSGIMRSKSLSNESYFILFCDDFSCYRHIFPLKSKEKREVYDIFMAYIAVAERQTGSKIIQFTVDRGGEFVNELLGSELRSLGIVLHTTAGHALQQNGVAERGNRTVNTKA